MPIRFPDRRSVFRVGPESTWTTVVPVAFIIASLLSLAILPIVFSAHTARMRQEIALVAEPARGAANRIQMDLSAELDKVIAFQVTGQRQFHDQYSALLVEEQHDHALLNRLSPQLNDDVRRHLAALMKETREWHTGVQNGELVSRQMPSEIFMTRLFERHPSYEEAVISAAALELAIQAAIDDRLARIRDTEKLNVSLTVILTLLALTSALLVAGLGRQMRLLAREAMHRRQEAEHEAADAKIARAAAEQEERRAAFLASAGQELATSLDFEHAVTTLAHLIVPNLAEACAIDMTEANGSWRRAAVAHVDAEKERELAANGDKLVENAPEALARVMSDGEARVIGASSPLLAYLGLDDERSLMAVPLVSRGQALGVVLAAAPAGKVFTREDSRLASELARRAALAIDNARLYLESQQAVRAREEVMAIVSHDLRNPLNAVTLAAPLLKLSQSISDDDREQLDIIELSAQRMRRLIEDLLDVTRLEGGKRLPIDPGRVDVGALLHETHDLFKMQAANSSITLQVSAADGVPAVRADRHRVLQVLSNLVGNAMKFTPPGGMVTLRAEKNERQVLFTVADTGPGIPKEHLGDIFNPYWQAKRAERLGAGLGLPIARGIVGSHGGRIWVESEPGVGTKFYFTLPIDDSPSDPAKGVTSSAESPARR